MKKLALTIISLILVGISFGNPDYPSWPCVSCTDLAQTGRCFTSDPLNGPGWCASNESIWEVYGYDDPFILSKPQCNFAASAILGACPE